LSKEAKGKSQGGAASQWHDGLDIAAKVGTPVLCLASGVVVHAVHAPYSRKDKTSDPTFGGTVIVRSTLSGITVDIRYAHLSRVGVKVGQDVAKGQDLGLSGNSGLSTGPHLHVEGIVDLSQFMADGRTAWLARR
jgi:murein DD-endopeptidase MepM/ murein hydrolase activator NlpD